VASALIRGKVTIAEIDASRLDDPEIFGLAAKVTYRTDPRSGYPKHYSGEVTVTTIDGRRLSERQQINSGAPELPVADAEIVRKFEGNASTALAPARIDPLKALILSADSDRPARDWAAELGTFH
jgi:2-methylcitrate dehydratase PrpD